MSISTIWILNLEELVEEVYDYLVTQGRKDMAEDFGRKMILDLLKDVTVIALNASLINAPEKLQSICDKFYTYERGCEEFINEFIDEVYLKVRHEMPEQIARSKNLYSVERNGCNLEVHLLVSEEAIGYGFNIEPLIELVV
jgi:polyhydroxyalkanoate synthesis regulator phasin